MTVWEEIMGRSDLVNSDLVCKDKDELYRGPIRQFKYDSAKKVFTITTTWVARYNPVTMRWVRWNPSATGEYGIDINTTKNFVVLLRNDRADTVRIGRAADGLIFVYLVPHYLYKLEFKDLD